MKKLSTKPPKQLMNPPEFKRPEPKPETGLGLWVSNMLYWIEELFEDKNAPKSSRACCGTYRYTMHDDAPDEKTDR